MYNLPNNIKKKIYKRSYYMITREVRKQVLKSMANTSYTSTTFLEKTSDMCFKQSTVNAPLHAFKEQKNQNFGIYNIPCGP